MRANRFIRALHHSIIALSACLLMGGAVAAASGFAGDPQNTGGTGSAGAGGGTSGAATQAGSAAGSSGAQGSPGAATGTGAALARTDQNMLKAMAQAQVNEIAAAHVALDVSKNEAVRRYAQTMIDDHTKALDNITTLARSRNVTLPTDPDAAHKAMAAAMRKLSGDAFDKAYMKQAGVSDHTKVHRMLQKSSTAAKDPELKALASTLLPTVDSHLAAAKSMQGASGTGGATSSGK